MKQRIHTVSPCHTGYSGRSGLFLRVFLAVLLFCSLYGMGTGHAQVQTATFGTSTSATTSYGPLYWSSATQKNTYYGSYIYLFTEDELLAQGVTPGSVISELAWEKGSTYVLINDAKGEIAVYINSGSVISGYAAAFQMNYTNSFTLAGSRIFDSSAANNVPAANGEWMAVPLTPFVYTGGGLEVYVAGTVVPDAAANSSTGAFNWRYTSTSPDNKAGYYSSTGKPSGTSSFNVVASRPNMRLKFESSSNNAGVHSLTSPIAQCAGNLDIKVNVRNNGKNTINNVQIHWTLDGVVQPTVNYNVPIGTATGPDGNNAEVMLGNRNFIVGQGHQLKVWTELPNGQADAVTSDDTLTAVIGAALGGDYTIGGSSPDYPDLVSAAKDLNAFGICGPVTFSIRPGTYTGQVLLDNVAGTSATNTITFVSQNRDTASVRITYKGTSAADNYVFRLANTSYVTLKHLSIQATGTTYGTGLELTEGASYNTIDSCHVFTSSTSSTSHTLKLNDRISGTGNTFTNNRIAGGYYCVYLYGTSTSVMAQDIVFDNNLVEGFTTYATYLYYTNNLKFRNNTIRTTNTTATQYGVYAYYCYGQLELTGNRITLQRGGYGIYSYYCNATAAGKGLIANNEIVIGKSATTSATVRGFHVYYSQFQQILNNSVHVLGGSATAGYAGYFYYSSASYQGNEVKNNIFANSGTGLSMYIYNAAPSASYANNVYDYNLYYAASSANLIQMGGGSFTGTYPTLAAWRAASSSNTLGAQDMHSINYRPPFTAEDNLRPDASDSAVWAINGRGEQIDGNGRDITGAYRSVTLPGGVPDLGAYEVTPSSVLPPLAKATPASPAASGVQVFTIGEDTVARITWGATVPASVEVRQYSGEVPAVPVTTPADMYFHTDVSGSSGNYGYKAEIYYRNPWLGNVPAGSENLVRLARKEGASPWASYPAGLIDTALDILTESGLPGFGQFTGSRPSCTGTPVVPEILTAKPSVPLCNGDTIVLEARDLNTTGGIRFQWQQASSASGPWTNVTAGTGANSLQYFPGSLTDTVYYHMVSECTVNGASAASEPFIAPVWPSVDILSVKDSSRCGPGIVMLEASAHAGTVISWFDENGIFLDTGSRFATPPVSQQTTFYAMAGTPGSGSYHTGRPAPAGTSATTGNYSLQFDALVPFTLESVVIYSNSSTTGTINIALQDAAGNTIASASPSVTTVAGQPAVVPLGFFVPAGSGFWLRSISRSGLGSLYYESVSGMYSPPYSVPGVVTIKAGATSTATPPSASTTYYGHFYDWSIRIGCQGALTPVTASVTQGPVFSISGDLGACNDVPAALTVTSDQNSFDHYDWSPVAGLYTDPAGTIPYTGGYSATVYARSKAAGDYAYAATALNTVSLCGGSDTVNVHVQPAPSGMFTSSVCFTGSGVLKLNPEKGYATGSLQWQSSPDNINWTDITGATGSVYNSPVLNNTTYYRAQVKNSQGQVCQTVADTFKVVNPTIDSVVPGRHCGPGSVTLKAFGSPGSSVAWYSASSGGTPLATGNTFATPSISGTTTFYAAPEESSVLFGGLPNYSDPAELTQAITGLSFDAYIPFTLKSVTIYVTSQFGGTITIELTDAAGATISAAVLPVPSGTMTQGRRPVVLPLNFRIPVGNGMRLLATGRGGAFNLLGENGPVVFPIEVPGAVSVNGGVTAATGTPTSNYYAFYDWRISVFCEVPRVPVVATIDAGPPVVPSVSVASSPGTTICAGTPVTFTATPVNGGTAPAYLWRKNGVPVGTNSTSYIDNALVSGDVITCRLTGNAICSVPDTALSNAVTIAIMPPATPSVTVSANPGGAICAGTPVSFTATPVNGGTAPAYQWRRNGIPVDTGVIYTDSTLNDSDVIICRLTSNAGCISQDTALSTGILMDVISYPDATITASGPTDICDGMSVDLQADDSGYVYQWYLNGGAISGETDRIHTASQTGDYTVSVSSGPCTATTATPLKVTLHPLPLPVVSESGDTLATADYYDHYQWYINGRPITGADDYIYTPSQKDSVYYVAVTDSNGCTGNSAMHTATGQDGVGISLTARGEHVQIYPNPASDMLYIRAPFRVDVSVRSMDGRMVMEQADAKNISLGRFADGAYMIYLKDKNGLPVKAEKIMKISK